jgi:hypothetical protein
MMPSSVDGDDLAGHDAQADAPQDLDALAAERERLTHVDRLEGDPGPLGPERCRAYCGDGM